MGTISDAAAFIGLKATGTPVGTNVNGTVTVGVANTQVSFPDADIAYSFKGTSTASGDVMTLSMETGVASSTTGSVTIVDGDGRDFEGTLLPVMARLHAVFVKITNPNGSVTSEIEDSGSGFSWFSLYGASTGGDNPTGTYISQSGRAATMSDITLVTTFEYPADSVEITIVGSST